MLAFLYLAMVTYFGDRISRHFFRFVSVPHRLATSFLTGLLLSTLITYLGSLAFARFSQPLVMGNLIFLAVFALAIYKLPRRLSADYLNTYPERPAGSAGWDWMCFGAFFLFACWLMFATLNFKEGKFWIGFKSWTDFGANISLVQSFVFGHNFPTTHPFFPVVQVFKYLGWSFGLKWLLILVALIFLSKAHRKLFLALSSLIVVVFLFQLSTDTFNNHKLLNVWTVFASIYAGYGLWRIGKTHIAATALACVLAVATIFGGIVDLFPIHNDPALTVPYKNDRLTTWLLENTKPSDVFLTQTLLTHPILFTGRKIFLGNTLFAWSVSYRVGEREAIYRRMFQERDPVELIRLLNQNGIAYVAIDSGVRSNNMIKGLNESVYQQHFEKVFDDTDRLYDFVTIYKVPSLGQAK